MCSMHRSLLARLQFAALAGMLLFAPDHGAGAGDAGAAAGDAGAEGADGGGTGDASDDGDKAAGQEGDEPKFTQAQVAEMVAKERAKAQRAAEADAAKKAERAKLDETERLKAEKAEAEQAATARIAAANSRLIAADAKSEALAAGVKPDRVAAFLRLVDTDGIEVTDDGDVDGKAVKAAVAAALKVVPEFKGTSAGGQLGGDMNGKGDKPKPTTLEEAVNARLAG